MATGGGGQITPANQLSKQPEEKLVNDYEMLERDHAANAVAQELLGLNK